MEPKCDLRPLCDGHTISHKRWGHVVSVLVGDGDSDGAPAPSTLLGVTHCPKPEHAGSEGCLSFACKQCEVLLCQSCIREHASAGHTVSTVDVVGKEKACAISAALPALRQGVAHQVAQAAQARSLLETLALNRSVALEALAAATARLHADVDARQAAMVREIDAAYDAKVAGLQRELSAARSGAAELATMVATVEVALAASSSSCTGSGMLVHAGRSVEASLEVARCCKVVDSDWCCLAFEAACVEGGGDALVSLGRLRTSSTASAAVSELCVALCLWANSGTLGPPVRREIVLWSAAACKQAEEVNVLTTPLSSTPPSTASCVHCLASR
jgi:hypothetical protein